MVLPLAWVTLALMAASTAANAAAQRKVDKATSRVMREDRRRRSEHSNLAERLSMENADLYANTPDKEKDREAELAAQYGPSKTTTTTDAAGTRFLDTGSPISSQVTIDETKQQIAEADARTAKRAAADAKLQAFGDVMAGNQIIAGRNAQDIGQSAGFVQGWQNNVMPAQMAAAAGAGRNWATAADVMKLAATIMAPYAMTAAAPANAAANTTSGTLGQMSGVPAEFAGQDLFGTAAMGGRGFGALSGMESASIADAAGKVNWMDFQQMGLPTSEFFAPQQGQLQQIYKMLDPFWGVMPGSRRGRRPPMIQGVF